ncbi:hypothetical protein Tco_0946965 [Tanacetum coccineum]
MILVEHHYRSNSWGGDGFIELIPSLFAQPLRVVSGKDDRVSGSDSSTVGTNVKQCLRKVSDRHFTADVKVLCSSGVAPFGTDNLTALLAKHPILPPPVISGSLPSEPHLVVDVDNVLGCIQSFPKGTSCGREGLRAQHILDALCGEGSAVVVGLLKAISMVVNLFETLFEEVSERSTSLLIYLLPYPSRLCPVHCPSGAYTFLLWTLIHATRDDQGTNCRGLRILEEGSPRNVAIWACVREGDVQIPWDLSVWGGKSPAVADCRAETDVSCGTKSLLFFPKAYGDPQSEHPFAPQKEALGLIFAARLLMMIHWMIPLFSVDEPCPVCRKVCLDSFGEHAAHCKELPGFKYRHDLVRDVLYDVLKRAGISSKREAPVNF